jgi:peptide/nickel transport system permease protein
LTRRIEPVTTVVTIPNTEAIATAPSAAAARTPLWKKMLRDPQAVITVSILIVIFGMGLLTPVLAGHGPNESDLAMVNVPPGTPGYPLGGDESGRDIFSRLLHSINTAAIAALIGTGVALVVGVTAGLVGGYFGRVTRASTEWLFSLIMTFPGILLLIILMPITGGDYRATMLIFGVLLSPGIYRIVRNLVLGVKNELYVDAARVSGLSVARGSWAGTCSPSFVVRSSSPLRSWWAPPSPCSRDWPSSVSDPSRFRVSER